MTPSPKPHERQALALAAFVTIGTVRDHITDFDGPVLWIDDDIRFDPPAREWLGENPRVVAMSPRTELGITRHQMEIVRRFVTEIATPPP